MFSKVLVVALGAGVGYLWARLEGDNADNDDDAGGRLTLGNTVATVLAAVGTLPMTVGRVWREVYVHAVPVPLSFLLVVRKHVGALVAQAVGNGLLLAGVGGLVAGGGRRGISLAVSLVGGVLALAGRARERNMTWNAHQGALRHIACDEAQVVHAAADAALELEMRVGVAVRSCSAALPQQAMEAARALLGRKELDPFAAFLRRVEQINGVRAFPADAVVTDTIAAQMGTTKDVLVRVIDAFDNSVRLPTTPSAVAAAYSEFSDAHADEIYDALNFAGWLLALSLGAAACASVRSLVRARKATTATDAVLQAARTTFAAMSAATIVQA